MRLAFAAIVLLVISTAGLAQDTIKVSVEEVRIPIIAKDSNGRFDPTVELNDLLVRDNGIAQPLKSVYRMPASEAREVARDIDSQYVMSYRPRPPLASSGPTEYRRIEVISRRVGLTVKSRRGYVVRPESLLRSVH